MMTQPQRRADAPPAPNRHSNAQMKARIRALVALALIVTWSLAAITGFLLYVAPTGPRSGRMIILLLTKAQWGDVHFWMSIVAMIVTVVHTMIDWKALKACVRFLVNTQRGQAPCE
jgi:hypothetical protein